MVVYRQMCLINLKRKKKKGVTLKTTAIRPLNLILQITDVVVVGQK